MEQELPKYYLYPSTLKISRIPLEIHTILGSCVAVCLYDPVTKTGGMNHFMLPFWAGRGLASPKYGNIAIQRLHEQLLRAGTMNKNLQAKVFGGANVLGQNSDFHKIGERNVSLAFSMLSELNIEIFSYSVGGEQGRKLLFNTAEGVIRQRMISKNKMTNMPVPEMKLKT